MVIFHSYVNVYQRVHHVTSGYIWILLDWEKWKRCLVFLPQVQSFPSPIHGLEMLIELYSTHIKIKQDWVGLVNKQCPLSRLLKNVKTLPGEFISANVGWFPFLGSFRAWSHQRCRVLWDGIISKKWGSAKHEDGQNSGAHGRFEHKSLSY